MPKQTVNPQNTSAPKLTPEAIARTLIIEGRKRNKNPEYKGVHVVFSGFNEAFRTYFGYTKEKSREVLDSLKAAGKIAIIPCRGGAMAYLPEDAPKPEEGISSNAKSLLAALGK